jgi:hypothetical protein
VKYLPSLPWRRVISDGADIGGLGCLVGAGWSFSSALGVGLLGGALLLVGWVVGNEPSTPGQ